MPPPLKEYRARYLDMLLDFLWREWTALGVAGHDRTTLKHVADPEALLLLTCSIGRYDPRLFDEVMDWLLKNGRYINVQRLRTILRKEGFRGGPVMVAVADWLCMRGNPAKWKLLVNTGAKEVHDSDRTLPAEQYPDADIRIAQGHDREYRAREEPHVATEYRSDGDIEEAPLFYLPDGRPLPVLRERDETFLRYGLLRTPLRPRGLSTSFPTNTEAARLLRLRALFGVSVRCDVLNYLGLNGTGHPQETARELYYAQKSVHDVLADLERAGTAVSAKAARERTYRQTPAGLRLLGIGPAATNWINWPVFLAAAESAWYLVDDLAVLPMSTPDTAVAVRRTMAPITARFTSARWAPPLSVADSGDPAGLLEAFRKCFDTVAQ